MSTAALRLLVHDDGRWALYDPQAGYWWVSDSAPGAPPFQVPGSYLRDPQWRELTVVELPEPDGWAEVVGDDSEDTRTPYWRTSWGESVTAWIEGIETPVRDLREDLSEVRADALKMLAAVAACERFRALVSAGALDVMAGWDRSAGPDTREVTPNL